VNFASRQPHEVEAPMEHSQLYVVESRGTACFPVGICVESSLSQFDEWSRTRVPKKKLVPGDFDLAVKRSSAGLGLFAREAIPKKACVIEYTGVLLTSEEYLASNSRYLFDVGRNKTIDGAPRWNRARYINHSCRPNCDIEIQNGRVFIQARRNIKPGEELSYDYGKEYFDEYIGRNCRCLKCRPELPAKPAKAVAQPKSEKPGPEKPIPAKPRPAKVKTARPAKPKPAPKPAAPAPRPAPEPVIAAPLQEQRRKAA
jgi:hypothetical protein